MQKLEKKRNNITYFTHIVMQIILGIFLTDSQSPYQIISSMLPSLNGAPGNSMKHQESVQTQKQEQYAQGR